MQLRQESIPNGYHLGHFVMDYFNNESEDHVWQIDAHTDEIEMKSSVRHRSIRLAKCLRNAGLKPGDVLVVSGLNHLDVHIPFYAGYLNGLPLAGIDPFYKYEEAYNLLETLKPKMVICETFNFADYERAVKDLGLDARIVTFGDGAQSMAKFLKKYDDNTPENQFQVATFDTDKIFAWLMSTSGTTGLPKVAAFKHTSILSVVMVYAKIQKRPHPVPVLSLSSVQWITGYMSTLFMIYANQIKVQSSAPLTVEHVIDVINKYKPVSYVSSPLIFSKILSHEKFCDLTCFKTIMFTGFAMDPTSLRALQARLSAPEVVWNMYGQTECIGAVFIPTPNGPTGNVGRELPVFKVQLVDPHTGEVVTKPNTVGELWTKKPSLSGYYHNPEATAAAFSSDGWFKTGDLLYKDENGFFFYVERMSSSYRIGNSEFISPIELELLIKEHPAVEDVCVVDIPHPEDSKQAVACVQRRHGATVTEQEIKNIIADKLSIHKHLHGGVIFVDNFPRTFSDKIARKKVRDFVLEYRNSQISEYPCSGNTKKLISTFQQLSSMNNVRFVSTGRN